MGGRWGLRSTPESALSAVKHRRLTAIGRDFGNYYYFDDNGKAGEGNVTMGGSGAKPGLEVTPAIS